MAALISFHLRYLFWAYETAEREEERREKLGVVIPFF